MTDEEKEKTEKEYKEWLANDHKLLDNPTYNDIEQKCFRAFFAGTRYGLAEGKPKWHDLRKDPNDLPKDKGEYRVYIYDSGIKKNRTVNLDFLGCSWVALIDVIAWCELPKFEG